MIFTKIIHFFNTYKHSIFVTVINITAAHAVKPMKRTVNNLIKIVLMSLLTVTTTLGGPNLQARGKTPTAKEDTEVSFVINTFLSSNWKLNLIVQSQRPKRMTVLLRGPQNQLLHREFLGRRLYKYWRKFDFEGSEPGVYSLEISDGNKKITRHIEIVDVPRVAEQRYLTVN